MAIAAMGMAPFVFAEHGNESTSEHAEKKITQMEKKLDRFEDRLEDAWKYNDGRSAVVMHANGDFRISGVKVKSVNADGKKITVEFFGFSREVSVDGTRLIGAGKAITLADFKEGDMLTGSGNFNAATRTISVREVHNLSYRTRQSTDIEARIKELLEMIRQLQEKIRSLR